ncbi:MAG: NUDIX hydrolase [Elusimicrobiota bacterium]
MNQSKTKKDFSCGGVVWDKEKGSLLLIQVKNLVGDVVWTFPKGHPENNESDQEAALREVCEETGWQCEVLNSLQDISYFYSRNGTRFHKTVRWFLMKPLNKVGDFNPQEVLKIEWFPFSEVSKVIIYDSDKELLRKLSL